MNPLLIDAPLAGELARHGPYLETLLAQAAQLANTIHSEKVGVEHLLGALLRDEESAANQAVVWAFADPETVLQEVLALCPGMLVVGSATTRPFSPGAVRALAEARASAGARSGEKIETIDLARACLAALPESVRSQCKIPGKAHPESRPCPANLHFSEASKLGLARAAKSATLAKEAVISPARILATLLGQEGALAGALGLEATVFSRALAGNFQDPTPLRQQALPVEQSLLEFLRDLAPLASSLDLLVACHTGKTPELAELLKRHKIGVELLTRAQGKFEDPS